MLLVFFFTPSLHQRGWDSFWGESGKLGTEDNLLSMIRTEMLFHAASVLRAQRRHMEARTCTHACTSPLVPRPLWPRYQHTGWNTASTSDSWHKRRRPRVQHFMKNWLWTNIVPIWTHFNSVTHTDPAPFINMRWHNSCSTCIRQLFWNHPHAEWTMSMGLSCSWWLTLISKG